MMGVLRPLRVVIENFREGQVEELEAVNNPEDPAAGTRKIPFSRVLYLERDDFMEQPLPKFYRSLLGGKCDCAMPFSSNASASSRTPRRVK